MIAYYLMLLISAGGVLAIGAGLYAWTVLTDPRRTAKQPDSAVIADLFDKRHA